MRASLSLMIWAAIIVFAAPVNATPVMIHYTNASFTADAVLDVEAGRVVGGAGTVSGGGLVGTLPITFLAAGLTPAPLIAVAGNGCNPAADGCFDVGTFSCGCNFTANDTVFDLGRAIPVDRNGIAFQAGGAAINYGIALYDAGDGTVGEIIVGDASPHPLILNGGTAGGTLEFQAVPEPGTFALLGIAATALGALRRARRHRVSR